MNYSLDYKEIEIVIEKITQKIREEIIIANRVGILKETLKKYKKVNRRNFLVSTDDFAHIFSSEYTDDDNKDSIEASLKATIIAIKRDFKSMSNYVPLVFKPRSMYTKGLFYIPDSKMEIAKEYGWDKYLSIKYNSNQLKNMSYDGVTTSYLGAVYEFDFKKCWEEQFNGKYNGLTFGNFKRKFYENDLETKDRSFMKDKMILTLESKHGNKLEDASNILKIKLKYFKEVLDSMKMATKHFSVEQIAEMYIAKDKQINKTFAKNIVEPILNLINAYSASKSYRDKFCDYNSKTGKYHIKSSIYDRKIVEIDNAIENYIKGYENMEKRNSLVDSKNNTMRNNPLIIAVQIMELFDLATYNFEAGNKPEFFVRVNSEETIRKVVNNPNYHSDTLKNISELHYSSVNYMKYFFEKLDTDEDRWQFIEDYFLGVVEDKYNIEPISKANIKKVDEEIEKNKENSNCEMNKKDNIIKTYDLFDALDNITIKYYISEIEIDELKDDGYKRLLPDCEVAKNLIESEQGKVFNINDYEYLVERIEFREIN